MQNIPDKGVSGAPRYLKAEHTVTGLSGSLLGVNRKSTGSDEAFPFWEGLIWRGSMLYLPAGCGLNCSPSSPAHRLNRGNEPCDPRSRSPQQNQLS